ncbi:prephenate dehydrogenase [Alienimonas californiensis]|uniref:Prephenate dehydrogenase n=1 Tax=Alienimonas californiensis TaxID=2527989 RepID=A0A517PD66_9PLAN|nr:prephenate dehydrogenase [Alienimonas californiensis]QDT17320.1 prephenate dehydrogenase [Alienimonas californiensis]
MGRPATPPPNDLPAEGANGPLIGTLGVVGVGLIGGSIAAAALKRCVANRVIGFGRDAARLSAARDAGLLDDGSTDPQEAAGVDLLVVCTPVGRIAADVRRFAADLGAAAVVTDAGSVKGPICEELRDVPRFVGSHPLAGSEKSGWEHADAHLFAGRVTVVCGEPDDDRAAAVSRFWRALGSRVEWMAPEEHDARLARTSHLPHAMAAALCLAADADPRPGRGDGRLTSTGFADTTRVAAGDPALWADIFHGNAAAVGDAVDRLAERLGALSAALSARDRGQIETWLADAAERRQQLIGASLTGSDPSKGIA